jgi:hypothetical protein
MDRVWTLLRSVANEGMMMRRFATVVGLFTLFVTLGLPRGAPACPA